MFKAPDAELCQNAFSVVNEQKTFCSYQCSPECSINKFRAYISVYIYIYIYIYIFCEIFTCHFCIFSMHYFNVVHVFYVMKCSPSYDSFYCIIILKAICLLLQKLKTLNKIDKKTLYRLCRYKMKF